MRPRIDRLTIRVAYLIVSHTLPDQVVRLARTLREGSAGAWVAVHHDDRRTRLDNSALKGLDVELVEPSAPADWGRFGRLAADLRCLRWALERTDAAWAVLISGQDYPIRPLAEIERSLAAAPVDAFVEAWPVERPPVRRSAAEDEFGPRYHCLWREVPARAAAPLRAVAAVAHPLLRLRVLRSGTWAGVPAPRAPFGPGLVCHRGADWFALSRGAVEAVDRFARARPDVLRHYRRTLLPSESFVHTVLANEPGLRRSGDHRRFALWDPPPAASPRVLRTPDLDGVLASGADFARKFDETVDRGVLDAIDRRVHGR